MLFVVTTPLDMKQGWQCCRVFNKMMKGNASYRMELGLLSSRQNLAV